jgi:rhodanese-related sulfurtransferase
MPWCKSSWRQLFWIFAVSAIISIVYSFFLGPADRPEDGEILYLDERQARQYFFAGKALWIDARHPQTFAKGHIIGAENIPLYGPLAQRRERFRQLPLDTLIITYCSSAGCPTARYLAEEMAAFGFRNVAVFRGGMRVWRQGNLPVAYSRRERR